MDIKSKICFLNKHNTKSNLFKLHSHDCYELVYFLSGSGKTIISGKSYPVSEHSYCIISPHSEHIEAIEGYGEILFIGFEYISSLYKLEEGVYNSGDITKYSLLNNIFKEYREQRTGFETAAKALLELFLIEILRNNLAKNNKCKDLNFIREYIENHSDQKINFRELSLLSGYSYDYFRHIFKQKFAVSPQQYLIDIRLNNAKLLLSDTNLSCTEIAYRCGFSNSAQMSTMFKEKWGIRPTLFKITD